MSSTISHRDSTRPAFSRSASVSEQTQKLKEHKTYVEGQTAWSGFIVTLPLEKYQYYLERGSSTVSISPLYVQFIELMYVLKERGEVFHFFDMYPFLVPLLIEAYFYVEKYFPDSKLFLKVLTDPEEFNADQLITFISVKLDPDKATEILHKFDKEWWLKNLFRAQGKLGITLVFE